MLKLPPPIWALIYVLFASAISWRLGWPKIPGLPFAPLGIALAIAACILPIWAILLFRREGTEVSPTSPTNQKLVISSPTNLPATPCIWGWFCSRSGSRYRQALANDDCALCGLRHGRLGSHPLRRGQDAPSVRSVLRRLSEPGDSGRQERCQLDQCYASQWTRWRTKFHCLIARRSPFKFRGTEPHFAGLICAFAWAWRRHAVLGCDLTCADFCPGMGERTRLPFATSPGFRHSHGRGSAGHSGSRANQSFPERRQFPFATSPGSRRSHGRGSARHSDLTPADLSGKDVLAVFDISQPSAKRKFYVLDFKTGQVTAHYAAHGRDNGPNAKAIKFKGFPTDLDMVPLGPLKTAHSEVMEPYKKIVDRYNGRVYPDMIVVALEGVTSYNSYVDPLPRSNGSSTRTRTPPLVFAPKIAACWGGATVASSSIRSKTPRWSRGFRMELWFS